MNFNRYVNMVRELLEGEELGYVMTKSAESIVFDEIPIGEKSVIAIFPNSINIFVQLKKPRDKKTMRDYCNQLKFSYGNVRCSAKRNKEITLFRVQVFDNSDTAIEIIKNLAQNFRKDFADFLTNIVTEDPETFFVNQYKMWKSIPPKEQSFMIEDILVLKEKYFRTTKTKRGIVNKLNKLKAYMIAKDQGKDVEKPMKIILGEDFAGSFEFYLIDFAALFRAIELELISLNLHDFFDNYKNGGHKK